MPEDGYVKQSRLISYKVQVSSTILSKLSHKEWSNLLVRGGGGDGGGGGGGDGSARL